MPITPRPEQMQAILANAPEGPLYMLNLLKFKAKAEYADGRETNLTGEEAYGLYGRAVAEIIGKMGGSIVFAGKMNALLIGDGELAWDNVAIVEYPSLEAFRNMTASAEYQAAHVHREAGLAHQLLINCLAPGQVRGTSAAS